MTRINPDDPKWTAYILGELSDSERTAVETELETSEEARALVEELHFAAELTKTELRGQAPILPLTQQGREAIRTAAGVAEVAGGEEKPRRWFPARPMAWAAGLAAASIALAVALMPRQAEQPRLPAPAQSAQSKPREEKKLQQAPNLTYNASVSPRKEAPSTSRQLQTPADSVAEIQAPPPPVAVPPQLDLKTRDALTAENAIAKKAEPAPGQAVIIEPTIVTGGLSTADSAGIGPGRAGGPAAQALNGAGTIQTFARTATTFLPSASSPSAASPVVSGGPAPGLPRAFDRFFPRPNVPGEAYTTITDNPFLNVDQNQLSTFSIDVDTASYANVRRFLNQNQLPPLNAVRIEEMINYFAYDYPQPVAGNPIGATLEAAAAPWNPQHRLVRIALKARDVDVRRRPPSNLVFLLDVSGSMQPAERLPLLKQGIRMMVDQLTSNDRVSVVTYAGTTGVALQPTPGNEKDRILGLIDSLEAGGSTNGGSGIQLAYQQAMANFIPNGVNRVILATDGDFNVGVTDRNQLVRMIEDKAKTGVFLTVLGVGMGNYKDATLETLADKGHGNYAYLDTVNEARKVLVDQMSSTFVTVAKDVKAQVEFNPALVGAYRLIGYEDRALRPEDFNNDQKDAGDMGAGHMVTALYEVVPRGVSIDSPGVDPLKYQQPAPVPKSASNETLTVKIRYKDPTASDSKLLVFPLVDRELAFNRASADFRFAASVASFGMLLRDSPYKGSATFDSTLAIAEDSIGSDRNGYRREFMQLVQRARQIRGR